MYRSDYDEPRSGQYNRQYGSSTDRDYDGGDWNRQGWGGQSYSGSMRGYGQSDRGNVGDNDRQSWRASDRYGQNFSQGYGSRGYGNENWAGPSYGNQSYGYQGYSDQGFGGQSDAQWQDRRGYGAPDPGNQGYGDRPWGMQAYGGQASNTQSYRSGQFGNQGYGNQGYGGQGYGGRGSQGQNYQNQDMRDLGWGGERYGGNQWSSGQGEWRGQGRSDYGRYDYQVGQRGMYGQGSTSQTGGQSSNFVGQGNAFSYGGSTMQSGQHAGKGPKGYQRSDERIREEVSDRLTEHGEIDASELEVQVNNGEVTLTGFVDDRQQKRLAEDLAEQISGVKDVHNQLRVHEHEQTGGNSESTTNGRTMARTR